MNKEQARVLVQKYNQGGLSEAEEALLEQYMEAGLVELEELEDIRQLSSQLDQMLVQPVQQNIRTDFYRMLEAEKQKNQNGLWYKVQIFWDNLFYPNPGLRLGYSLALLVIGMGLGVWFQSTPQGNRQEMAQLSSQLEEMREMMMLSMLEKESTTERLKAVNLTQGMEKVSDKVAAALLHTLNHDENVNVRLSALEALYPYAGDAKVREGLIKSIDQQQSPLVQLALAEVMVSLQEKRSIEAFQELLQRENVPGEVKKQLQNSIEILL